MLKTKKKGSHERVRARTTVLPSCPFFLQTCKRPLSSLIQTHRLDQPVLNMPLRCLFFLYTYPSILANPCSLPVMITAREPLRRMSQSTFKDASSAQQSVQLEPLCNV